MSTIEWTDQTWNPVRGCSRVSPGCINCYAERIAARFSGLGPQDGEFLMDQPFAGFAIMTDAGPRWTGRVELIDSKLMEPMRWRKPRRVFVNSMSDLFHEALTNDEIAQVFAVMALTPHITYQVLTKRSAHMAAWAADRTTCRRVDDAAANLTLGLSDQDQDRAHSFPWPLPNVHAGVSVENQEYADKRIPDLLRTPAAARFLSCEPLLGPLDLSFSGISWVVVGGESGPGARPCRVGWIADIIDQCRRANVACFVKQLGSRPAEGRDYEWPNDLAVWGERGESEDPLLRSRKGSNPAEWPEALRVREFPR